MTSVILNPPLLHLTRVKYTIKSLFPQNLKLNIAAGKLDDGLFKKLLFKSLILRSANPDVLSWWVRSSTN